MSPEKLTKKETVKREANTIIIYTTDTVAIGNLLNGNEKNISQISIDTGIEFQKRLQASLAAGKEPQRFLQVTIKKVKDQTPNKLEKGQFWGWKLAWRYWRKRNRDEEIGKITTRPSFFNYFFPAETNLKEIIKKDYSRINNLYSPVYQKEKENQLKKIIKEITPKGLIKLEIISIVRSD